MVVRRVATVVLAWVAVVAVTRGVIALPERCPPVTAEAARGAAEEAVGWFARNQHADGSWVYRYDRAADVVDRRTHVVRQAGITLSLYQAHAAGVDGALEPADDGVDWLLGELVHHDDWSAVRGGEVAPTGGTALLVAALATRYQSTGDTDYHDEMRSLGRFLVAMTEPSGSVLANWDGGEQRPVPGDYSPFYTGEAYFALGLLATVDPSVTWTSTARSIGTYLATARDDAEGRFPPTPDHWASYGLAQMAVDLGQPLDAAAIDHARRLAGIFGVSVRHESQRTGSGLNRRLLRGPQVLGAGLGTMGEGLGSLWRVAQVDGRLAGERSAIGERLRCVAGMLADRQVSPAEASDAGRPGLARGAWFHGDVTQMDDQQHALSALLLAEPVLVGPGPTGDDDAGPAVAPGGPSVGGGGAGPVGVSGGGGAGAVDDGSVASGEVSLGDAAWLAVIALAAVNPARVRRLVGPTTTRPVLAGSVGSGTAMALAALGAGPLLRAADVSPSTGLIAAGGLVVLAAVADALARRSEPVPPLGPGAGALLPIGVPALVRPAVMALVVAASAAGGVVAGVAVVVGVVAGGVSLLVPVPHSPAGDRRRLVLDDVATWAFVAIALVGGLDLVADGVFAV